MRMMETIRQKGSAWLIGFLAFFLVSVFAGLGISGGFSFGRGQGGSNPEQSVPMRPMLSEQSSAVMTVNGSPVEQDLFNSVVEQVLTWMRDQMSDPGYILDVYSMAASRVIQDEVIAQMGEKLGVQVTSEELAEAKANAIAPYMAVDKGPSGNIIGDATKGLSSSRARKVAFKEHLSRAGLSEQEWKVSVRGDILRRNTMDVIQENADAEMRLKAEETKVLVDEALAEGEVFQDVARQYSDDQSASRGGDIGTWVKRGLLRDEIENVLYTLDKGETSDWFEVEIGFQKFHVYARKDIWIINCDYGFFYLC